MKFPFAFRRNNTNKRSRTSPPPCRRRPMFEVLEDRVVPAVNLIPETQGLIAGTVFHDVNANGAHEASEPAINDVHTVYVDANNNGQLDPGEITTITDANGDYQLVLAPGQYSIRLDPGPTETITWPPGGSYNVTLKAGFAAGGRDFGSRFINPAQPLPSLLTDFPDAHNSADEHYIQDVYRKVLGRDGEPGGVAFWVNQLHAGQSGMDATSEFLARQSVALQIWRSAEHRGLQVDAYYRFLLDRAPDDAGKTFWVNSMLAGASETDVVQAFLTSTEYQGRHPGDAAFVTALYNDLLGRQPDAGGLAAWQQALQQGATRIDVVVGLLFSTELFTTQVESYYEAFLNRPAETAGLTIWVGLLQQRILDTTQVGATILASAENALAQTKPSGPQPNNRGGNAPDGVLMPSPTVSKMDFEDGKVLAYDRSANLKTITITNNSNQTIYPILQGTNSRTTPTDDPWYGTPLFDPQDNLNNEYRGYIGYSDGGTDYMGLPKHQSLTVNVPLVFWDGGRINIATDPTYLKPSNPSNHDKTPIANPFHYHDYNVSELDLATTTSGSDMLRFTGKEGKAGGVPATLMQGFVPDTIRVTGPGISDTNPLYIRSSNPDSIQLSGNVGPADSQTNVFYAFTWPLPANPGDTPPGPRTARYTVDAVSASKGTGRIMWYHALTAETPANDAPAQLLEMTFRDGTYLKDLPTWKVRQLIPKSEVEHDDGSPVILVNYDVSYVDSIVTPVAMEATDVTVINHPDTVQAYGWVGASQEIKELQPPIAAFASANTAAEPNKNGLGTYFADAQNPLGNGYPSYYMPSDILAKAGTKLPSGQNLVAQSPFNDVRSSYDNDIFTLTSGGGVTKVSIGGQDGENGPGQDYLILSTDPSYLPLYKALKAGLDHNPPAVFNVSASQLGTSDQDYVPKGTTLSGVEEKDGNFTGKVFLSQKTNGNPKQSTAYDFTKPVTDYAASRLLQLWYSWANYYVTHLPAGVTAQDIQKGTIAGGSRVLTFDASVTMPLLVPGMVVNGPGTVLPIGTCRIMRVDGHTVYLSQDADAAGAKDQPFHFALPQYESLAGYNDPQVPPKDKLLNFTNQGLKVDPFAFSQHVYQVMSAMSTIPNENSHPRSLQVLLNVIGCNVGKLPNIGNTTKENKDSNSDISNEIRDFTKSLLRGVADFGRDKESNGNWYPDPSEHTGGQDFNILNLDPFVWFVHKKLGLSGYGFSVDDDVADVGADKATKLQAAIGGLGAHGEPSVLPLKAEWTWGAPFGPQTAPGTVKDLSTISVKDSLVFWEVFPTDAKAGFLGALVNGQDVKNGTRAETRIEAGNTFTLDPDHPLNSTAATSFSFYGSVTGKGTVNQAEPKTITLSDPDVVAQLNVIGPGVLVSGPGVTKGTKVLKVSVGDNKILVDQDVAPTTDAVRFTFA